MANTDPSGIPLHEPTMPPVPAAPPTAQGHVVLTRGPAAWPTVIGVITIILGVGGVINGLIGSFAPVVMNSIIAGFQTNPIMGVVNKWQYWNMGIAAIGGLIAVILLVGGILLFRRRAISIPLLRVWAIAKILLAIVSSIAGTMILLEQSQVTAQQIAAASPGAPPIAAGAMDAFGILGIVFGFLWMLALPVFLLIWFRRKSVRTDVHRWKTAKS